MKQVGVTPPEETRRRQREVALQNEVTPVILVLVPFAQQPLIEFDNIRLGQAAVRKLSIQNPDSKNQIQV